MENKVTKRLREVLNYLAKGLLNTIILLVLGFLCFGSITSIILLRKMYPEVGIRIAEVVVKYLEISVFVIRWFALIVLILLIIDTIVRLFYFFKKEKKRRAKKREDALDDLAVKISKRLKNNSHKTR